MARGFAGFLLLLTGALLVLVWSRSYRCDEALILTGGSHRVALHAVRGRIYLEAGPGSNSPAAAWESGTLEGVTYAAEINGSEMLGFRWGSLGPDCKFAAIPCWLVTILAGAGAVLFWRPRWAPRLGAFPLLNVQPVMPHPA